MSVGSVLYRSLCRHESYQIVFVCSLLRRVVTSCFPAFFSSCTFVFVIGYKEGQKLYYPRLVKFGKMVNTQKMAELIAEKASLTAGDVHNVIRNLMSVMREQLLNSRTVRLEGLGTFTMIAKAGGKGVELESKVSSSQITSLRCQFTPEYTRAANGSATRALTTGVEFVHIKDVAGSFVADDVVDKDPDDGDEPGGGGGEAPDPAA